MVSDSQRNRSDSSGRYIESVTPSNVLTLFEEIPGPAMTTSDVTSAFDVSGETARNRLDELYINGNVAKRQSGRTNLYWQINDWREPDDADTTAQLVRGDALHLNGPDFDFPVAYTVVSKRRDGGETVLGLEPQSMLGRVPGGPSKYDSESLSTKGAVEYWVQSKTAQFIDDRSMANVSARQIDAATIGPALPWRD
jgi:hypothetical protein